MRLSAVLEDMLADARQARRTASTIRSYKVRLGEFVEFLGDTDVTAVTPDDIAEFTESLQLRANRSTRGDSGAALSVATINGYRRAIKRLFRYAGRPGLVAGLTEELVAPPQPLSDRALGALLKAASGGTAAERRDLAIVTLFAETGLRPGEICGLCLHDLDLPRLRLRVGDTPAQRHVDITQGAAVVLARWLEVRLPDDSDWLFVSVGDASTGQLLPNGLRQVLLRLAQQAGLSERVNPYAFRHRLLFDWHAQGVSVEEIGRRFGYTSRTAVHEQYGL